MRRADRLFRIVELLRQRRRAMRAADLAAALEVSVRTVYRDVAALFASGVPIEGEAGVGYLLRGYDLPPLMFTRDEIEAAVLGARILESWADPELAAAARSLLAKVEAALPSSRRRQVRETALFAPGGRARPAAVDLAALRQAIREARKIRFAYLDASGRASDRVIRPLALAFFGPVWVLSGWCELRRDFRGFRPDRMSRLAVLPETFVEEAGRSLADLLRLYTSEEESRRAAIG